MASKKSNNPFPVTKYKGPEYFCDRQDETQMLIEALSNDRSVTLHSIRRIGKTGLIQHVLHKLGRKKNTIAIYVDVFDTQNVNDFVNKLCSAVLKGLEKKQDKFLKTLTDFFGKYRPKISFDTVTGDPSIELDIVSDKELKLSLDTLMHIIKNSKKHVIIAIDEFQQINYYETKTLSATLRQYLQTIDNLNFIFSGSERELLLDMFSSPKQAFFRSTQLMPLEKINRDNYEAYIKFHFKQGLRPIPDECVDEILAWTERHTYYTQYLCHRLYERVRTRVSIKDVQLIQRQILLENKQVFYNYKRLLSPQQWKLLKALALENMVFEPTSKGFINKYNLGSHSTVRLSLNALLDKQLAYFDVDDTLDKSYYKVYDVFLVRWFESL